VLREDGSIDRKKLGEIVFADPEERARLERFTHPRIGELFRQIASRSASERDGTVLAAVVPLLIERRMQEMFDRIVLVYLPEPEQLRRLMLRDELSEEQARRMLAAQLPIDEKRQFADHLIDNSGSLEQTEQQVEALWARIKGEIAGAGR
jgi:dephospho-CoA kinase